MANYKPDELTLLSSFGYEYDLSSRRTKITREDGSYTKYEYNHAGWLTYEGRFAPGDILEWQDEYSYDLVGNRTAKIHTEPGDQMTIHRYAYNKGVPFQDLRQEEEYQENIQKRSCPSWFLDGLKTAMGYDFLAREGRRGRERFHDDQLQTLRRVASRATRRRRDTIARHNRVPGWPIVGL